MAVEKAVKHDKYYEGYLQLRNCDKKVYDYVKSQFKENQVYIAKETKQKNGFDYQVSSNKFILRLGNELVKMFSGRQKVTSKLFTRDNQTGKPVYRMTVLFEQLPFKVGDIIDDCGDDVKVLNISSQRINVKNVKTGKKYFLQS